MKNKQTIKYVLQAYLIMIIIALVLVGSIQLWKAIKAKYSVEDYYDNILEKASDMDFRVMKI